MKESCSHPKPARTGSDATESQHDRKDHHKSLLTDVWATLKNGHWVSKHLVSCRSTSSTRGNRGTAVTGHADCAHAGGRPFARAGSGMRLILGRVLADTRRNPIIEQG